MNTVENKEFDVKVEDSTIKIEFVDEDTINVQNSIIDILTASYNERNLK